MTGIDYFSAMLIASEIGDITRFNTPEKLVSWSGLCPSIRQSGNSLYMGRMKDGNKKVRWILIVVRPHIGDIIAYQHGLHFCQEVYHYRNQNKVSSNT
ncbi:MAG: IS110 family transposase, partial [Candidatus Nitrosopolaris sp.]